MPCGCVRLPLGRAPRAVGEGNIQVKALVATPNFILLVDVANRTVTPLESGNGEYYGLSWFPGARDIVTSHSGLDHLQIVSLEDYAKSELGWIASGR